MKPIAASVAAVTGFCVFLGGALHHLSQNERIIPLENGDLFAYYHPLLSFAKEAVRAGTAPLWNPYQSVGRPFLATFQCGLLYPPNWLIFLFDVPLAMLLVQLLTVMVGGIGTMFYLHHLKIEWGPTMLGAVLFGSSVFAETFNMAMGSSYCWLPLVFWAGHRLADGPSFGRSAMLSVLLLLCLLGGFPQYFFYTSVLLCIYLVSLVLLSRPRTAWRRSVLAFGFLGLSFVMTLGLASVQLLPTIELSLNSIRSVAAGFSSGPQPAASRSHAMASVGLQQFGYFWEMGPAIVFLPFAFGSRRKGAMLALGVTLLYIMVFVHAKRIPDLGLLSKLPFADAFRFPERFLRFGHFMMAALTAVGLSSFLKRSPLKLRTEHSGKPDWPCILAIMCTAVLLLPQFRNFLGLFRTSSAYVILLMPVLLLGVGVLLNETRCSLRSKIAAAASMAILACSGMFIYKDIIYPAFSLFVLILVLGLMLVVQSPGHSAWAKSPVVWTIAFLILIDVNGKQNAGLSVPAFLTDGSAKAAHYLKRVADMAGYDRVLAPGISPNHASVSRVFNVDDYEPLTLTRWQNFVRLAVGEERFDSRLSYFYLFYGGVRSYFSTDPRFLQMMGLASLRYLLTEEPLEQPKSPGLKPGCNGNVLESDDDSSLYVYENEFSMPRVYLVSDYVITNSEEESLEAIENHRDSLRYLVVLEDGSPSFSPSEGAESSGEAGIRNYGTNEVRVEVKAVRPSLLILTDSYFPGWKAYVDGEERPIWRANSLFRAVEVAAGRHAVMFRYRPASVRWGFGISLVTLAFVMIGVTVERHRMKRSASTEV
ncbi:MAG: hypothetical protein Kow0099_20280 [Candidatus Abyssubacteria bacterium]